MGNAPAGGKGGAWTRAPSVPPGSWLSPEGREGSLCPMSNTEEAMGSKLANSPASEPQTDEPSSDPTPRETGSLAQGHCPEARTKLPL